MLFILKKYLYQIYLIFFRAMRDLSTFFYELVGNLQKGGKPQKRTSAHQN